MDINSEELKYLLALSHQHRNATRKVHTLLEQYGSATDFFKKHSEHFSEEALQKAQTELQFIEQHKIDVHYFKEESYPYRLVNCIDNPILLFTRGTFDFQHGKCVAIVGTRTPTERGKELCRQFILDLAQKVNDLVIISGLAYGIDITAHRAALEANIPTYIVLGHGLDTIYPSLHRDVVVKALTQGGVISEYLSGVKPDRHNFIFRNRIIAGLADAVVVVESKEKGGSLITAQTASDYNRDLFAFPGRVSDTFSAGCNQLIKKQQAYLIENADDVIDKMGWEKKPTTSIQTDIFDVELNLSGQEQVLLQIIRSNEDGIYINNLVSESQMNYADIMPALLRMEIEGIIKALPGNVYMALK